MSAMILKVAQACSQCAKPLTLEEMHYLDAGNGTATCSDCEGDWMEAVDSWKRGDRNDFPSRD